VGWIELWLFAYRRFAMAGKAELVDQEPFCPYNTIFYIIPSLF